MLYRLPNREEAPIDHAVDRGFAQQARNPFRTRISTVKPVTKTGNEPAMLLAPERERFRRSSFPFGTGAALRIDLAQQLHTLLTRAAMHIAECIHAARNRAIDSDSAGDRHARDCDRWRLRTMIHSGNQHRAQ